MKCFTEAWTNMLTGLTKDAHLLTQICTLNHMSIEEKILVTNIEWVNFILRSIKVVFGSHLALCNKFAFNVFQTHALPLLSHWHVPLKLRLELIHDFL